MPPDSGAMRIFSAAEVDAALDYAGLADSLGAMFREGCEAPLRHHHTIPGEAGEATLLLMPAWRPGQRIGVKVVTVFPSNGSRGLPSVLGSYLLLDGSTGTPLATIDGRQLTLRRTAAASALAARFLARQDAARLLMVGAGALAPHLIGAHRAVRPIREIRLWNHRPERARALAERLAAEGLPVAATEDLEGAARWADVVSCATLSREPLIKGAWLAAGSHLDLVGAFTPALRESDDEAIRRASVFVDAREGAAKEGGDIAQPLAEGVMRPADIAADLFELCRGAHPGRRDAQEITLFKSVGTALEDLAAAEMLLARSAGQ